MKFMRRDFLRAWGGPLIGFCALSGADLALGQTAVPGVLPTGNSLRVVTYNVDADTGTTSGINGVSESVVQTVLAAIGNESLNGHSQPIDVLALEELQGNNSGLSPTLATITKDLNDFYGAGTYAYDTTVDTTTSQTGTGNGPSGLIYNTKTVKDLGAKVVAPASSSTGDNRSPIRYTLQAAAYGAASKFYVYVDHYKADGGTSDAAERNGESTIVRNDADALPTNSHIIYTGDFNLAGLSSGDSVHSGSQEQAYKNLTAPAGTNLINSSGGVGGVATAVGQAFDPLNPAENFVSNTNAYEYLFTESAKDDTARFDMQLVSSPMQTGSAIAGFQVIPYTQTAFGNNTYVNGVNSTSLTYTTHSSSTASVAYSGNTALADLPNRTTVLSYLTQLTDHLPMVSDYSLYLMPGDANGDGVVNASDISILMNGQSNSLTGWANGDFNGDGVINQDDWGLLDLGLAMTQSSTPVPEPGVVGITAIGGVLALSRKRPSL